VPELRRYIAGEHVDSGGCREVRCESGQRVEAFVNGDTVNDIQKAVINAARMQQAIVFSAPSR
jgi:hypothetical protein